MKTRLRKIISSPTFLWVCRLVLGGVFIYASLDKIAHPADFARIIHNYKLFPAFSIYLAATVIPWVEMIAGIFLVIGVFPRAAAGALSLLLVIFAVALTINLVRGLDFNCGCFSATAIGKSDPLGLILRDILLLIPGLIVFFSPSRDFPCCRKKKQTVTV